MGLEVFLCLHSRFSFVQLNLDKETEVVIVHCRSSSNTTTPSYTPDRISSLEAQFHIDDSHLENPIPLRHTSAVWFLVLLVHQVPTTCIWYIAY